jgi:hypothetical protein
MDNPSSSQNPEFKRRLIRHLETAYQTYQQQLIDLSYGRRSGLSRGEIEQAQDDVIKMIAMLKR